MRIHRLKVQQQVHAPLEEVWDFFSDPRNLSRITPPDMDFKIIHGADDGKIYPGKLIEYIVRPFPWMKSGWLTEITAVSEGNYFVDEQRFGPYELWNHRHEFEATSEGTLMTDEVQYKIPYGIFGRLGAGIVRKKVTGIFEHRRKVIEDMFGDQKVTK